MYVTYQIENSAQKYIPIIVIGMTLGAYHKDLFWIHCYSIFFLFLEKTNICNFADDNTIYRCDSDLEIILEDLQHDMKILLSWFKINLMKPNSKKFHFMILGIGSRLPVILNINNVKIKQS